MLKMLEVQKALKGYMLGLPHHESVQALEWLKEETGVKFNIWEDQLVVLNYCQIDSDKRSPIAQECRSLVLEMGTWEVVSRSFDRFFNYGEEPCPALDISQMTAYEKVDGSLIGLFYSNGGWMYRTRSVIMPTSQINGWEVTWDAHIEKALGRMMHHNLRKNYTYILELTSPENRVVTRYGGEPTMTLLAMRNNEGGHYNTVQQCEVAATRNEWRMPRMYFFDNMSECLQAAKDLRNLEEGYVLYNRHGEPMSKIKNPAYVAAHHLRGEGLNPRRIKDLIFMKEVDEYLAIFPEDTEAFKPYQAAYRYLCHAVEQWQPLCENESLTQKEFAWKIAHLPFKGILFSMRKGTRFQDAWEKCTTNTKYQLIDEMMK